MTARRRREPRRSAETRVAALDARWSRTVGLLLLVTGIASVISAVTAEERALFVFAGVAEMVGLRFLLSARAL